MVRGANEKEAGCFSHRGLPVKRVPLVLLLLQFSSLPGCPAHSQEGGARQGINFSATSGVMREASRTDGGWAIPFTARTRLEIFRYFHVEIAWNHVFTHRHAGWICPGDQVCPGPGADWGALDILTAGGGVNMDWGVWQPFLGLGKGRGWEHQRGDRTEYNGPLWTWYGGMERRIGERLSLLVEYRGFWQYWENDYVAILKDIHLRHHQVGLGVSCSLY